MLGPHYFGRHYFGTRYFGGAAAPATPTAPVTLFAAIKARFGAAGLDAVAPGGLWLTRAKAGTAPPFVTVAARVQFSEVVTASIQIDRARITLTATAASLPEATALARTVETAYRGQSFAWTAGNTSAWRRISLQPAATGRPGPSGVTLYTVAVEFEARLTGSP